MQCKIRTAFLTLSLAFASVALAQRTTVTSGLVLTNVTVVDVHTGKLLPGMSVAMDGGKITKIVPARMLSASGSTQVVDMKGKYLVPGYWEMHAHPLDSPDRADNLTLMLANGITGVRQMSGSDALLKERRDGTLMPAADVPELLAMPGSVLLRGNSGTIPMAIAEVDKQKNEGADFIKTIDVTQPVFFAALEEATKQGLIYDGHISPGVDAVKASDAGMRVIEHLGPTEMILISCSTDEAAVRQEVAARAAAAKPPAAPPPASLVKAATANPYVARAIADPAAISRLQHLIDTFSEEKCRKVAAGFAAHQTWQVPTLIRLRTMEIGDDPAYRNNPNLQYVGPATRQLWTTVLQQFNTRLTPADRATLKQVSDMDLRIARIFKESNVPLLAGSDFGGMWLVAGFSLHQEFDLLAQAQFPPLKILQMTTLDGARLLGREDRAGSVEQGKDANLVILDANPLSSAANLHGIYGVVRGGKYYGKDALDGLKQQVKAHVQSAQGATLPAEKATP